MQRLNFNFLVLAIFIVLTNSTFMVAQQTLSPAKVALIAEFRKLTGADKVNRSINFSTAGIKDGLFATIDEEKEITEGQKQELRQNAAEAAARIEKPVRDFLDNKTQITQLEEEVIHQVYNKAFTEDELKELIAFYRTPTGQKAAVFLPSLSSQVQKEFGEVMRLKLQDIILPRIETEKDLLKQKINNARNQKGAN